MESTESKLDAYQLSLRHCEDCFHGGRNCYNGGNLLSVFSVPEEESEDID